MLSSMIYRPPASLWYRRIGNHIETRVSRCFSINIPQHFCDEARYKLSESNPANQSLVQHTPLLEVNQSSSGGGSSGSGSSRSGSSRSGSGGGGSGSCDNTSSSMIYRGSSGGGKTWGYTLVRAHRHQMQQQYRTNKNFTTASYPSHFQTSPTPQLTVKTKGSALGITQLESVGDFLALRTDLATAPKSVVMDTLERAIFQHSDLPNVLSIQRPLLKMDFSSSSSGGIDSSISDSNSDTRDSNHDSNSNSHLNNHSDGYSNSHSGGDDVNNNDGNSSNSPDSPLLDARGKFTVCGDTHGQFMDFVNIFREEVAGFPTEHNPFLFNGDMVDRGDCAFEIVLSLVLLKLAHPSCVHILRGNHETTAMNEHYGFAKEVMRKQDREVLEKFRELFRLLPIAAVIDDSVFVVHGGIGRHSYDKTIALLNSEDVMNRKVDDPPLDSLLSELLWSDPRDGIKGFRRSPRGGGTQLFGADASAYFLQNNNLQLMIRSHEVQMDGFDVHHGGRVVTIFSAPNYCGVTGNLGAVIRFDCADSMEPKVIQFGATSTNTTSGAGASNKQGGSSESGGKDGISGSGNVSSQ